MSDKLAWEYNEHTQVGRDYGCHAEVDLYDSSHSCFRDIRAESIRILDLLSINAGDVLVDYGSGTGTFVIEAARRGARVHAVDVSQSMLDRAREKSEQEEVTGISFHHAGFLTFELPEKSVDAIVTMFSFHHLPDYWKGVALKRLRQILKPDGQLYLYDVIIEENHSLENISGFISKQEQAGGEFLREDAVIHFRDEYSTYDWVMDGMLERAGFKVVQRKFEVGVLGSYLCRK